MKQDRPPDTVRSYLDALQRSMKAQGCKPGVIADALSDCEEHLNNEIAWSPGRSEADVLAGVVETYGTPEEIAEEYKSMEAAISGPFPKTEGTVPERRYGFFNVVRDPSAYGALMYMLLSLVTGVFYFTVVVTGLALSVGLFILIIGIPFAVLFIGVCRVLGHVEGRIVEGLLAVRMPRRLPAATAADETIWTQIKEALVDIRTWSTMFYLALMLPLGIAYFTIAVTGIALSVGLTLGSIWSLITGRSDIQISDVPWLEHLFHTAPGLVVLMVVGVLLFFIMLHIARGIGWLHGRIAELLLVRL
jgi:uncharacterized membrane protein